MNKTKWTKEEKLELFGDGEWVNEPDYLEFEHEGYKCIIKRRFRDSLIGGHLCGYVQLDKIHPLHGIDLVRYSLDNEDIVHGGITYSESDENNIFRIGFDCGHSGDIIPFQNSMYARINAIYPFESGRKEYRNIEFAKAEVKKLAEWAKSKERE